MSATSESGDAGRSLHLLPRWVLRTAAACGCFLLLAATLWVVSRALTTVLTVTAPVVVALLLTALLEPLMRLLTRARLPAWLAALSTILVTLVALAGIVVLLVDRARAQESDLRTAVTDGVDGLRNLLLDSSLPISADRLDAAGRQISDALLRTLPAPATGAGIATEVLSGVVLTVFLWFFFLKDGRAMWTWAGGWVPERHRAGFDRSGNATWEVLTRYVRGTTLVAAVDAVGIGIGMVVLGVPLAASLTLIVFVAAYVPIVGAFVSGALAVGVTLVTVGPVSALVLFGVVLLVQQLEGNLLQPLVMGRALRLHPVAIVIAVAVGALVEGVLGAIVAVPLVSVVHRLALQARDRRRGAEPAT